MKITGIKLTFNPQKAFYAFLKITLVVLWVSGLVLSIVYWSKSEVIPIKVTLLYKSNEDFKLKGEDGRTYSIHPTKDWYESAREGDVFTIKKSINDATGNDLPFVGVFLWVTVNIVVGLFYLVYGIIWIVDNGDKEIEVDLTGIKFKHKERYKGITE